MAKQKHFLSGRIFFRLTVLGWVRHPKLRANCWECECRCGNKIYCQSSDLLLGRYTSCGCTQHSKSKFGDFMVSKQPEYVNWIHIKDRCFNTKSKVYESYGGAGITMYEGWINNFKAFYDHIGAKPSNIHSVDRFPDRNGGYMPGNVRWATPKEQCRNQNTNINLTHNGKTMILSDWATALGVKHEALRYHLKFGRNISDIITHITQMKLSGKSNRKWKTTFG